MNRKLGGQTKNTDGPRIHITTRTSQPQMDCHCLHPRTAIPSHALFTCSVSLFLVVEFFKHLKQEEIAIIVLQLISLQFVHHLQQNSSNYKLEYLSQHSYQHLQSLFSFSVQHVFLTAMKRLTPRETSGAPQQLHGQKKSHSDQPTPCSLQYADSKSNETVELESNSINVSLTRVGRERPNTLSTTSVPYIETLSHS